MRTVAIIFASSTDHRHDVKIGNQNLKVLHHPSSSTTMRSESSTSSMSASDGQLLLLECTKRLSDADDDESSLSFDMFLSVGGGAGAGAPLLGVPRVSVLDKDEAAC
mmetsp:Transcript_13967/g.34528  ORF Transcript_13967/g.34528 Transcript_13967/m.34528 type:complete len:107 (-) Transcript_13967:1665-1985(-)